MYVRIVKRRLDPHVALALGVAVVLAAEWGYRKHTSDAWLLLEAAASGASLLLAWREQSRLRLGALLALATALAGGYVALHLGLHVRGDIDSRGLYQRQGQRLLDGHYPRSEYPVGAVLLFALENWLGGGATRTANAIVMVPFHVATVAAIWATRTRWSPWLAAVVALWPLNAFLWEFKFDLVPTALLAAGLVLALRERWSLAGIALGLGTLVKWTPGLAFLALAAWLLVSRRRQAAVRHVGAFVATVALVYLPFLVWRPHEVLYAYHHQAGRRITPESVWFLPLHPLGLARLKTHISFGAGAPHWANVLAVLIQAVAVIVLIALAARARSLPRAVALAALVPVAFLLLNKIWSAQFVVPVFAALAIAGALVLRSERQQLAAGIAACVASLGNAFVYPFALPHYGVTWQLASLVLFALALALTAAGAISAARGRPAAPRSP